MLGIWFWSRATEGFRNQPLQKWTEILVVNFPRIVMGETKNGAGVRV